MTRLCIPGILSTAVLLAFGASAAAQSPLALSLDQAVQRAVAQTPRLAEARAREAAATANVTSRSSLRLPSATMQSTVTRINHIDEFAVPLGSGIARVLFPDIPNNYRVRGDLAVPLVTGGRVGALVDAARADLRAAGADRSATEEDVRLECARAYWTLVTARASVTVLEQTLARMDAWVEDVRARVNAGVLPPNDLLTAQAERARQSAQLIQTRNAAAVAEIELARAVGAPAGQVIVTTTPVDEPAAGMATVSGQTADVLVAGAQDHRAERAALQFREASLRASGEAAFAATRPQIAALAAVEPARPNNRFVPRTDDWRTSWDLGVSVNWSVFDGGRARADRAASLAQADATVHRREEFDAALGADIRERLLDLESDRAALAAMADAVAAATEARRVVGERFNAGVATATDVLDAQLALVQVELQRTQLTAALRLGEARLLRALGAL